MTHSRNRGRLLVVGTPIGNLDDLSPRGRRALAEAHALFCEDTRVTAKLAARFELRAPRVACPAPRESSCVRELLDRLGRGETVALVSDAGMPTLSDPGARLVEAARDAGHEVAVVPGPSAPAAALALSGLPAVPHTFLGFLPAREGERRRFLEALRERPETLVWFEAPHRLPASLETAAAALGARQACVARELTKVHEEALRGTLPELARRFRESGAVRGEITVVVEGAAAGAPAVETPDDLDARIRAGLESGETVKELSRRLAKGSGRTARSIYARALALRDGSDRARRSP